MKPKWFVEPVVVPTTAGRLSTLAPLRSARLLSGESSGTVAACVSAGEWTASARIGTLLLSSASTPSAPVLAIWMRPGMNASFEKPAATKVLQSVSMPRFSKSFCVCRTWPIISSLDHTTIHAALRGHQPLLCSHCFDFAEICSYGCGQPQSVNFCAPTAGAGELVG